MSATESRANVQAPKLPVAPAMMLTTAVGLLIAMGEVSRLSGQVLDGGGRAWSFSTLMGLGSLTLSPDAWRSEITGASDPLRTWFWWYLTLDIVFIGLYALLGRWLIKHGSGTAEQNARRRWLGRTVLVLAAIDLLEDVLAFLTGRPPNGAVPDFVAHAVIWASRAKWAMVAVVLLVAMWAWSASAMRATMGTSAQNARKAVYTQRFSLLFVVLAALVSLIPGADILDQLPDVERSWVEPGRMDEAAWAAALAVLSAVLLFVLGRLRSDHLWDRIGTDGDARERSRLSSWLAVPVPFLGAALLGQVSGWGETRLVGLLIFAALPVVIAAASAWIRHLRNQASTRCLARWAGGLEAKAKPAATPGQYGAAARTGDVAAVSVLVIAGLGLVRAFTAPVALDAFEDITADPLRVWALMGGLLVAVGAWPLAGAIADRLPAGWTVPAREGSPKAPAWFHSGFVPLAFLLLLLAAANVPGIAGSLGVAATLQLALLLVVMTLGTVTVLAQNRKPPEVFWISVLGRKLTSAPVFTLLVALIVAASVQAGAADVHAVRGTGAQAGAPIPDRPDLATAFGMWEAATRDCGTVTPVEGRLFRIRVMPLLAAEGGGIRAAYWTSAGVDLLTGTYRLEGDALVDGERSACRVALFSGGASGGAVGLTISRFADRTPAHDQVIAMARSSALGQASLGLVLRDFLYPTAGIPLAAERPGWRDRAALIEDAWVREWRLDGAAPDDETGALSNDFLPDRAGEATARPPGFLVLNSTSVSTGCRVLVSQIDLPSLAGTGSGPIPCDRAFEELVAGDGTGTTTGPQAELVANSLDFFGYFGGAGDRGCAGNIQAVTAAMLAARFPYVTPSGVVGCPGGGVEQLVDGGYVENSGIGTIVDLAPIWLDPVRSHNEASLASGADVVDLIVPMVVYFDNDTAGDLAVTAPGTTLEAAVPPVGFLRALTAMGTVPTLLQRAASVVDASSLWSAALPDAGLAAEALKAVRPRGVIVVNQSIAPAVTAPLGWTMSEQSIQSMNQALIRQAGNPCETKGEAAPESKGAVCARGYGSLRDALNAFGGQ